MHTYGTPDKVRRSPTTVHVLKDHYKITLWMSLKKRKKITCDTGICTHMGPQTRQKNSPTTVHVLKDHYPPVSLSLLNSHAKDEVLDKLMVQ